MIKSTTSPGPSYDMYERNKMWVEEKRSRIHTERERQQEMEMKECVFTPNIRGREGLSKDISEGSP